MGSESLDGEDIKLYMWHDRLDPDEYVEVSYYLETAVSPETAAVAMAKEQSSTLSGGIAGVVDRRHLSPYSARVTSVQSMGETETAMLPFYRLSVPIYSRAVYRKKGYERAKVKIAFPIANFGASLTNLWSAACGELHRLGFIDSLPALVAVQAAVCAPIARAYRLASPMWSLFLMPHPSLRQCAPAIRR